VDTVGRVEDISNVLMMDVHESGQTAMLLLDEWNEQYLVSILTNHLSKKLDRFITGYNLMYLNEMF